MENTQIAKEIFDRLDLIGAKLGVAAGHIWPVLIRQSMIDGYRDLTIGSFLFLISAVSTYGFWRIAIKEMEDDGAFFLIPALMSFIFCCPFLYAAIGELLNPEYYALEFIKSALVK